MWSFDMCVCERESKSISYRERGEGERRMNPVHKMCEPEPGGFKLCVKEVF